MVGSATFLSFSAHNHTAILTESYPLCLPSKAMTALAYSVAYSASFEPVPVEVKTGSHSTVHAHGACVI